MRVEPLAILLLAGHAAFAQAPAGTAPVRPPTPSPNVVPLSTAPPWWNDPEFDRHVTLVINGVDLDTAIDALGRAANISLVAAGGSKARKKVSLNLRDAPLRDVMLAVANLYSLTWFRTGEVYTLTYVSAAQKKLGPPATTLRQPTLLPLPPPPSPVYRPRSTRVRTR